MSVTTHTSTGCDIPEDWRSRKQAVIPLPVCFVSFITYPFSVSDSGKMFLPFLHSVQTGSGAYLLTYFTYLLHEAEPFSRS